MKKKYGNYHNLNLHGRRRHFKCFLLHCSDRKGYRKEFESLGIAGNPFFGHAFGLINDDRHSSIKSQTQNNVNIIN